LNFRDRQATEPVIVQDSSFKVPVNTTTIFINFGTSILKSSMLIWRTNKSEIVLANYGQFHMVITRSGLVQLQTERD